jgi:predicted negative regulator of RcsB-dependent stress response
MKKFLIIFGLLILACGGFLTYDWYSKTQMQEPTPAVKLYSSTE